MSEKVVDGNKLSQELDAQIGKLLDGKDEKEATDILALLMMFDNLHSGLRNAEQSERPERAAHMIVDPLLSIIVSRMPEKVNKLHKFVEYDPEAIREETTKVLGANNALTDAEISETMKQINDILRSGTGNKIIDDVLEDIVQRRLYDESGKRCGIKRRDGFFNNMKSTKETVKASADMHLTMAKTCRSLNDLEIWLSRFLYSGPLNLAKQGYLRPLQITTAVTREEIAKEIMTCAAEFNIKCSESDIDYNRIDESIHSFCRTRTGWNSPYEYYCWLNDTAD